MVDDSLREAVIERLFLGSEEETQKEGTKEVQSSGVITENKSKSSSKYDLSGALKQVLENKVKHREDEKPAVTEEERKMCSKKMDKPLLREMLGILKR